MPVALDHLGRFDFHFASDCLSNESGVDEQLVVAAGSQHELKAPKLAQYELRFDWVDGESDAIVGRSMMVQFEYQIGYVHVRVLPSGGLEVELDARCDFSFVIVATQLCLDLGRGQDRRREWEGPATTKLGTALTNHVTLIGGLMLIGQRSWP